MGQEKARGKSPDASVAVAPLVPWARPPTTSERSAPEELSSAFVDERRYGKVTRTVTLPESIDPESIAGKLTDGVLHITVAKKPEAQPKRIEIG